MATTPQGMLPRRTGHVNLLRPILVGSFIGFCIAVSLQFAPLTDIPRLILIAGGGLTAGLIDGLIAHRKSGARLKSGQYSEKNAVTSARIPPRCGRSTESALF